MKKIIQMVADGGGDLGVHVYPLSTLVELFIMFMYSGIAVHIMVYR